MTIGNDNRFYKTVGRFPAIEEDVEPLHLLTTDYAKYWKVQLGAVTSDK